MKLITILLICLAFYIKPTYAQTDSIRWSPDTLIKWTDFTGTLDSTSTFDAHLEAWVKYTYHYTHKGDVYHVTFKVDCFCLQQKSWSISGKQNDALLKHEQLHFDIEELVARGLFIALNEQIYSANLKAEIRQIFDREIEAGKEMQLKYDTQTNHSKIKDKQIEWEQRIKQLLDTTPPHHY